MIRNTRTALVLTTLLVVLLMMFCGPRRARAQRTYWVRSVDTLATGAVPHTHVQTTGTVSYVANEDDGDVHFRLTAPSGRFIICECIPAMMCVPPRVGDLVTVRGIYRRDAEHGWWEIHPVESVARVLLLRKP